LIQLTPQTRILVAVEAVDFRKGIDGLACLCRQVLASDPFSGWIFVFRNRRATSIKALTFDGRGFWLHQMRLSRGRFRFWPVSRGEPVKALEAHELHVLLSGGDFRATRAVTPWRSVSVGG
jgi:transposase